MDLKRAIGGPLLAIVFFVFFAYAIFGVRSFLSNPAQNINVNALQADVSAAVDNVLIASAPAPDISAESAISVLNDSSGQDKILFSKNPTEKLPIASVSKLMTALVFIENFDISNQITVSQQAVALSKDPEPLRAGEKYYAKDLLYAMLIGSDNAASFALAEGVPFGPGTDKFVSLMNAKAQELGLADTSFLNATGLGLSNFSTVQDLVKLADYLLKNHPSIFGITTAPEFDLYTVDGKTLHKINTTDELLNSSPDLAKRIFGAKTGDTPSAKECLLLVAKPTAGPGYLVNIILGSRDRFGEMKKIINWDDSAFQWQAGTSAQKTAESPTTFNLSSLGWEEAVSSAPWEKRDSHAVVVYNNKIWLMGGLDANGHVNSPGFVDYNAAPHFSDVWSSVDGTNWVKVADKSPWGDRRSIELVNFKGKIWLMGGYSPEFGYLNDVWSTEDGINWKQETASAAWPAREGHQLVVFQDKIWLIGGVRYDKSIAVSTTGPKLFNDVWYSSDGINWTEATAHANWSARWDHAVTVFQNKLWLSDGMVFGGKLFKDVWSSADGVNWVLASANPPFETRQGNFITEYKGKLWVIGRLDAAMNGGVNDIWYSDDGVNWQKTKNNPLWLGREDFCAVVFQDRIWIIGGMDRNWEWTSDVWYSTN